MNSEKWSVLMAWLSTSPDIPAEVNESVETLIDERQNEGAYDEEEEEN
jgi:hypothetical protein